MINYLMLFVALLLSAIAAFYSIAGLAAIFAAAVIPIVIMGSVLEAAKLISASWVYRNWNTAPTTIKYYLTAAIVVLMFITSMGTFGYLSRAHIEHTYSQSDNSIVIKNLEREIKSEEQSIVTAQRSIDILDRLVSEADTKDANWIRNRQRKEREALNSIIRDASDRITTLNTELTPYRQQSAALEAEVGPLKYVADLIYGESNKELLEKAVRWVIIIIVIVFDPLAVVMLLAANHSFNQNPIPPPTPLPEVKLEPKRRGRPPKVKVINEPSIEPEKASWDDKWFKRARELISKKRSGIVEIDKKSIVRMK